MTTLDCFSHRWWQILLLLPVVLYAGRPALGQDCAHEVLCIEVVEQPTTLDVYVVNRLPHDITVRLEADLVNLVSDVPLPLTRAVAGRARTRAFSLRRQDVMGAWRYEYRYTWQIGRLHARHDDRYRYALPYAAGQRFELAQGYGGSFSHRGRFALDWTMPEGTPIHAAREGVVVAVRDSYREGGLRETYRDKANFVLIGHADGTVAQYAHLRERGALVRVGERVQRGQLIGLSGNTGYSSGPHLHFEVFSVDDRLERKTLPVEFDLGAAAGSLVAGRSYRAR